MPKEEPRVPLWQRRVATKLLEWRNAAGVDQKDVAPQLGWSRNKLHNYEQLKTAPGPAEVIALATTYRVSEAERDRVVNTVLRGMQDKGLWEAYDPGTVPDYFRDYLEAEAEASTVHSMEIAMVPGLVQTASYADALIRAWASNELVIKERRELRQKRQARIDDSASPLHVHAIVHELALHQQIGGDDVMREQRDYLITRSKHPNIKVQVLPTSVGAYPGFPSSYHVLRTEDDDVAAIYLENFGSGLYSEDAKRVEPFILNFERLADLALDSDATQELIMGLNTG